MENLQEKCTGWAGFIKIVVLEYPPTNTPEGNFDTQLHSFVGLQSWTIWNFEEMKLRSNSSLQQMLAEMGIIRNGALTWAYLEQIPSFVLARCFIFKARIHQNTHKTGGMNIAKSDFSDPVMFWTKARHNDQQYGPDRIQAEHCHSVFLNLCVWKLGYPRNSNGHFMSFSWRNFCLYKSVELY